MAVDPLQNEQTPAVQQPSRLGPPGPNVGPPSPNVNPQRGQDLGMPSVSIPGGTGGTDGVMSPFDYASVLEALNPPEPIDYAGLIDQLNNRSDPLYDMALQALEAAANTQPQAVQGQDIERVDPNMVMQPGQEGGTAAAPQGQQRSNPYKPGSIKDLVWNTAASWGWDDPNVLMALVAAESNFNPFQDGDSGQSWGLLQAHIGGGRGYGHTVEDLTDPEYNLAIAKDELTKWYMDGKNQGLSGPQLAVHVGRYGQRPAAQYVYRYGEAYDSLISSVPAPETIAEASGGTPQGPYKNVQTAFEIYSETPEPQRNTLALAAANIGSTKWGSGTNTYCLAFVEQVSNSGWQGASAIGAWDNNKSKQRTDIENMREGDWVFFSPNAGNGYHGHVALYDGAGGIIGVGSGGVQQFGLQDWLNWSGQKVLGYIPYDKITKNAGATWVAKEEGPIPVGDYSQNPFNFTALEQRRREEAAKDEFLTALIAQAEWADRKGRTPGFKLPPRTFSDTKVIETAPTRAYDPTVMFTDEQVLEAPTRPHTGPQSTLGSMGISAFPDDYQHVPEVGGSTASAGAGGGGGGGGSWGGPARPEGAQSRRDDSPQSALATKLNRFPTLAAPNPAAIATTVAGAAIDLVSAADVGGMLADLATSAANQAGMVLDPSRRGELDPVARVLTGLTPAGAGAEIAGALGSGLEWWGTNVTDPIAGGVDVTAQTFNPEFRERVENEEFETPIIGGIDRFLSGIGSFPNPLNAGEVVPQMAEHGIALATDPAGYYDFLLDSPLGEVLTDDSGQLQGPMEIHGELSQAGLENPVGSMVLDPMNLVGAGIGGAFLKGANAAGKVGRIGRAVAKADDVLTKAQDAAFSLPFQAADRIWKPEVAQALDRTVPESIQYIEELNELGKLWNSPNEVEQAVARITWNYGGSLIDDTGRVLKDLPEQEVHASKLFPATTAAEVRAGEALDALVTPGTDMKAPVVRATVNQQNFLEWQRINNAVLLSRASELFQKSGFAKVMDGANDGTIPYIGPSLQERVAAMEVDPVLVAERFEGSKRFIGSIDDIITHPDWYDLKPHQRGLLDAWQKILDRNRILYNEARAGRPGFQEVEEVPNYFPLVRHMPSMEEVQDPVMSSRKFFERDRQYNDGLEFYMKTGNYPEMSFQAAYGKRFDAAAAGMAEEVYTRMVEPYSFKPELTGYALNAKKEIANLRGRLKNAQRRMAKLQGKDDGLTWSENLLLELFTSSNRQMEKLLEMGELKGLKAFDKAISDFSTYQEVYDAASHHAHNLYNDYLRQYNRSARPDDWIINTKKPPKVANLPKGSKLVKHEAPNGVTGWVIKHSDDTYSIPLRGQKDVSSLPKRPMSQLNEAFATTKEVARHDYTVARKKAAEAQRAMEKIVQEFTGLKADSLKYMRSAKETAKGSKRILRAGKKNEDMILLNREKMAKLDERIQVLQSRIDGLIESGEHKQTTAIPSGYQKVDPKLVPPDLKYHYFPKKIAETIEAYKGRPPEEVQRWVGFIRASMFGGDASFVGVQWMLGMINDSFNTGRFTLRAVDNAINRKAHDAYMLKKLKSGVLDEAQRDGLKIYSPREFSEVYSAQIQEMAQGNKELFPDLGPINFGDLPVIEGYMALNEKLNEAAFYRFLNTFKIEQYEAYKGFYTNIFRMNPETAGKAAAKSVQKVIPYLNTAELGITRNRSFLENALLTSSSFIRAPFMHLWDAPNAVFKSFRALYEAGFKGMPITEVMPADELLTVYHILNQSAWLGGVSNLAYKLAGRDDEAPGANPFHENFGKVPIGDVTYSFPSRELGYIRDLMPQQTAEGEWKPPRFLLGYDGKSINPAEGLWRTAAGRLNPFADMVVEQVRGVDTFTGLDTNRTIQERIANFAQGILPITGGNIIEEVGTPFVEYGLEGGLLMSPYDLEGWGFKAVQVLADFFGATLAIPDDRDRMDRIREEIAREQGFSDPAAIPKSVLMAHDEYKRLRERQETRWAREAELGSQTGQLLNRMRKAEDWKVNQLNTLQEQYTSGTLVKEDDPFAFVDVPIEYWKLKRKEILTEYRGSIREIREDHESTLLLFEKFSETPFESALTNYYNIFDESEDELGNIDWEKYEELVATWESTTDPKIVEEVYGLMGYSPNQMEQDYKDAQKILKPIWDLRDDYLEELKAKYIQEGVDPKTGEPVYVSMFNAIQREIAGINAQMKGIKEPYLWAEALETFERNLSGPTKEYFNWRNAKVLEMTNPDLHPNTDENPTAREDAMKLRDTLAMWYPHDGAIEAIALLQPNWETQHYYPGIEDALDRVRKAAVEEAEEEAKKAAANATATATP